MNKLLPHAAGGRELNERERRSRRERRRGITRDARQKNVQTSLKGGNYCNLRPRGSREQFGQIITRAAINRFPRGKRPDVFRPGVRMGNAVEISLSAFSYARLYFGFLFLGFRFFPLFPYFRVFNFLVFSVTGAQEGNIKSETGIAGERSPDCLR